MVATNNRLKSAHFWDMLLCDLVEIQNYFGSTAANIFSSSPDLLVNF
jgi:hypothetical protein